MMTKTAGLEGTAVLSGSRKLQDRIGVVEEAVAAFRTGWVHAMHDCTEGGVLGALFEMSLASGVGFEAYESRVPVAPETRALCRRLAVDPLKLIGSGSLLLSVEPGKEAVVERALRRHCTVAVVGTFVQSGRTLVRRGGRRERVGSAPEDELWQVLSRAAERRGGPR